MNWLSNLFGIPTAFAQQASTAPAISNWAGVQHFLCSLIGWFFWIVIVVSVIMVLVAAFDYVTAGDNTEKTTRGRKRLTYAAIGIAVALLAFEVPSIVSGLLGSTTSLDPVSCQSGVGTPSNTGQIRT